MQTNLITRILGAMLMATFLSGCLDAVEGDDTDSADTESATSTGQVNETDSQSTDDSASSGETNTDSDSDTFVKGCSHNGETFDYGDVISSVAGTNCGDCVCETDGTVGCVDTECVQMCLYGGNRHAVGETFPADDGCNTCSCSANGNVACTKMACMPNDCADEPEKEYFEPGCGGEAGMPVITAGCYQPCDGSPCGEGICQVTDINPCICEPGMACCDACGAHEYLCLDAPTECGTTANQFAITGGGKSFGQCMGECQYTFSVQLDNTGACANASLEVCGWGADGCTRTNIGHFTPLGNALLSGLATELMGHTLEDVYGCPDCADGGASQIALVMDTVNQTISYEYRNPPEILRRVDAFATSIIDALNMCTSNANVIVANSCQPPAAP